jgi:hypothetical protein
VESGPRSGGYHRFWKFTQGFIARILAREDLGRVGPEKGRFRRDAGYDVHKVGSAGFQLLKFGAFARLAQGLRSSLTLERSCL